MVCDAVAGLQDVLQKEPVTVEAPFIIQNPQVAHVSNSVQDNQHPLAAQLQQM